VPLKQLIVRDKDPKTSPPKETFVFVERVRRRVTAILDLRNLEVIEDAPVPSRAVKDEERVRSPRVKRQERVRGPGVTAVERIPSRGVKGEERIPSPEATGRGRFQSLNQSAANKQHSTFVRNRGTV
jgi:hypothetical protein